MRRHIIMYLLMLILVGFTVSACGEDEFTNPENANWSVIISKINDVGNSPYKVSVNWIGGSESFEQPYSVKLKIGEQDIQLANWDTYWLGEAVLQSGTPYLIELIIDDFQMCKSSLFIVNDASAYFPDSYSPAQASSISWNLNGSNQQQRISVVSFNNADNALDDFEDVISPSARNYYLPADVVQSFGGLTTFTLEITQLNTKTVNDVLLISSQSQFRDYGFGVETSSMQQSRPLYYSSLGNGNGFQGLRF